MIDAPSGPVYVYRAEPLTVYDGDTFTARVDCGFRVYAVIHVRVRGVDTPEMKDRDPLKRAAAHAAQEFAEAALTTGTVLLRSYKDRESFARWVCDVWVNGAPLDRMLIEAGHGVEMIR